MDNYRLLAQAVTSLPIYQPSIYSGMTAFIISALMDIRHKKSMIYTITGALVCGITAIMASALLTYINIPSYSCTSMGGIVGFIGADRLRDIAITIFTRRTGININKDEDK